MLDNIFATAVAGSLALSGGGSGLLSVPSAQLMPADSFEYMHTDGLPSASEESSLGRRLAAVGRGSTDEVQFSMIPRVEFGARLTTWYDEATGTRTTNDLSGHVKLQLLNRPHFRVAAGARDFAGEGSGQKLVPAQFVVADFDYGPLQFVAGYGRADEKGVSLDGAFGGIQYAPTRWLSLLVDNDGAATHAGINLHTTKQQYAFYLKAYSSDSAFQDFVYSAGVRVSLGRSARGDGVPRMPMESHGGHSASLGAAQERDVMRAPRGVDALASSPVAESALSAGDCQDVAWISSSRVPVLTLPCGGRAAGAVWSTKSPPRDEVVPHVNLRLEPAQRYVVGSEVGRFDYSLALRPSLQALIWGGLSAHVAFDIPVADSDDYRDRGVLAREAFQSEVMEYAAQYTAHVWRGFFVQASGGQTQVSNEMVKFVRGEMAWLLWDGRVGLNYSVTDFEPEFTQAAESQALGKLFVWMTPGTYAAEFTAGRFLYGDSGARLDLYKYLGAMRLGLFYKADSDLSYAGMTVSVPLGSGGVGNRWVSIAGAPHYSASLQTEVNSADGRNAVRPSFMREFSPQRNLLNDVLDQWRASPAYVRSIQY